MLFSVQNTSIVTRKKGKMCVTDTYMCTYAELVGKKPSVRDSAGLKLF